MGYWHQRAGRRRDPRVHPCGYGIALRLRGQSRVPPHAAELDDMSCLEEVSS